MTYVAIIRCWNGNVMESVDCKDEAEAAKVGNMGLEIYDADSYEIHIKNPDGSTHRVDS